MMSRLTPPSLSSPKGLVAGQRPPHSVKGGVSVKVVYALAWKGSISLQHHFRTLVGKRRSTLVITRISPVPERTKYHASGRRNLGDLDPKVSGRSADPGFMRIKLSRLSRVTFRLGLFTPILAGLLSAQTDTA